MRPAETLAESAQQLELGPLRPDDPRYASLDAARATKELSKLEKFLRNAASTPNAFAKAAFIGSRGAGKSTYLLHLENEFERQGVFTTLHIYLDPSLESDCTYSDLLLWMVDEVAREFQTRGHPIDEAELRKVAEWFAEKSFERTTDWKKEIGVEASAGAEAKSGFPGLFSVKILARLKSMIVGSELSRKQMRQHLQNYANELRDSVNAFLDHARAVLKKAGKPDRLLIVQDNLDRLKRDTARQLFESGGDILTEVRADLIYTAPLALNLAPYDIQRTFGHVFTMPNVKVKLRDGKVHQPGIDGLIALIARRLAIDKSSPAKTSRASSQRNAGAVCAIFFASLTMPNSKPRSIARTRSTWQAPRPP